MLRFAVALAIAAVAVPSAAAAPSMVDTRADLYTARSAEVAQAMRASGFEQPPAPSAGLFPHVAFDWGDAAVGVAVGAGAVLLLLGRARPALMA